MIQTGAYTTLSGAQAVKCRGTSQGTDSNLIWMPPSYKAFGAGPVASETLRFPGVNVGSWALHNRSGSPGVHAIGVRIPKRLWKAGQWVEATTTFTDDTTDAQDSDTNDFALETTTNDDGHVILCRHPFNFVTYNVSTASVDATDPARAVTYSNGSGSWASALSNLFIHDGRAGEMATGENIIAFAEPLDWGKTTGAEGTNIPIGWYAIKVASTTAPDTTAALAKAIEIGRMYYQQENVTDNSTLLDEYSGRDLIMAIDPVTGEVYGDALLALFETANSQNRYTIQARMA